MARSDQLGEFVRTRRARVSPELVGLDGGARRRVPGLRREELARLAHVSVDYIVRLEQGRIGRPSSDILEALARSLLLDPVERRHLFGLAATSEPALGGGAGTHVRPGLELLVRSLEPSPAVVLSRRLDLLVCNPTAEALLGPFGAGAQLRAARLRRSRHACPARRLGAGRPGDRRPAPLRRRPLPRRRGAARARRRAARRQRRRRGLVGGPRRGSEAPRVKRYAHPTVGELTLHYEALLLADDGDQLLTIYAAEPGTRDAERLAQVTELAKAAA